MTARSLLDLDRLTATRPGLALRPPARSRRATAPVPPDYRRWWARHLAAQRRRVQRELARLAADEKRTRDEAKAAMRGKVRRSSA